MGLRQIGALAAVLLIACSQTDDGNSKGTSDAAADASGNAGSGGSAGAAASGGTAGGLNDSSTTDSSTGGDSGVDGSAGTPNKPLEQCALRIDQDVVATPSVSEPGYLTPLKDPTFGTSVTRVSGDPGNAIGTLGKKWGDVARHGYSKRQPWNADESLLYLDRDVAVFLDGHTFAPKLLAQAPVPMNESRWHPSKPAIRVYAADSAVGEWNVLAKTTKVIGSFPGYKDLHIGPYEGNLSHDGSHIALYGLAPNGKAVAFAYDLAKQAKDPDIPLEGVAVDWVSISPLGTYVVVNGWNDETQVYTRTGVPVGARWSEYGRPSHYDLAVDGKGDEVAVGVSKSKPDDGRVIKRGLKDGVVTVLTPGGYASHTSTRNIKRPGYAYVTYNYQGNVWLPYRDEIVAVPLDGSMAVQRLGHLHALALDYLGESQGVPTPDGRRVVFASDWGAGPRPVRAYVIDTAPACSP